MGESLGLVFVQGLAAGDVAGRLGKLVDRGVILDEEEATLTTTEPDRDRSDAPEAAARR